MGLLNLSCPRHTGNGISIFSWESQLHRATPKKEGRNINQQACLVAIAHIFKGILSFVKWRGVSPNKAIVKSDSSSRSASCHGQITNMRPTGMDLAWNKHEGLTSGRLQKLEGWQDDNRNRSDMCIDFGPQTLGYTRSIVSGMLRAFHERG